MPPPRWRSDGNRNAPSRRRHAEIHRMRLAAAGRSSFDAMMNFYKANWPRAPYSLDMPAIGGRLATTRRSRRRRWSSTAARTCRSWSAVSTMSGAGSTTS